MSLRSPYRFSLATAGFCLLSIAALTARAQSASEAPPSPAPAPQTATIKTNVRLVVIDVVVKDKSHHPIHGLTASDFNLTEAGKPQAIRNFEEHTPTPVAEAKPPAPLPPGQFSNVVIDPPSSALNIVLLDSLNTPFEDQIVVRDQLLSFLRHATPGTRVAIFALTTRLLLLQGFTSDLSRLRAVVDRKSVPHDSPLLASAMQSLPGAQGSGDAIAVSQTASVEQANAAEFEAFNRSFLTQIRVRYTLDALNALGRYLSAMPGRKNLIWFSGSFPINILPSVDSERNVNPFAGTADMQDEFRDTTDLLSRARVSVYPVDARGVAGAASSDSVTAGDAFGGFRAGRSAKASSDADAHSTMLLMADQTGGQAFYNTNDLARAVNEAVGDGSTYYTLAYTPANPADDGSYRPIHVALDRPGVTLEYRRGYFAEDAKHVRYTDLTTSSPVDEASLRAAMMHGAPDSTQLNFRIATAPVKAAVHPAPALDNVSTPQLKGPFQTLRIQFLVDPAGLGFQRAADNRFAPSVRFLIFAYDREGHLLGGVNRAATSTFDAAQVHGILQHGLQFPLEVDVPAKQDVFLRVGVVDRLKRRFGSLEILASAVRSQPAVDPLPPPPADAQPTPDLQQPPAAQP